MRPSLEQLFVSPDHNYFGHHGREPSAHPTLQVRELHCIAGRGIVGDRFFNYRADYAGQITFFSAEIFDELRQEFSVPDASPGQTRRNATGRGLDLIDLSDRDFCLQGVWFRGAGECKPCYWMNQALAPDTEAWLRGRGGLRARILTDGTLRPGPAEFVRGARHFSPAIPAH
jgi:MOSC domain-containing protein YiiM